MMKENLSKIKTPCWKLLVISNFKEVLIDGTVHYRWPRTLYAENSFINTPSSIENKLDIQLS